MRIFSLSLSFLRNLNVLVTIETRNTQRYTTTITISFLETNQWWHGTPQAGADCWARGGARAYCRGTARRSAAWCWWWHLGATRVRASHHPVHQRSGAATGGSAHVSGGTPPFFSPMRCAGAGAALPTCRPVVCHHHVITAPGGGGRGGGGARGPRDPRVPVGGVPPRVLPCPASLDRHPLRCGSGDRPSVLRCGVAKDWYYYYRGA
jgi:hypothetical protein